MRRSMPPPMTQLSCYSRYRTPSGNPCQYGIRWVLGCVRTAPPGDVLVGSYEHEIRRVDAGEARVIDRHDIERNRPARRCIAPGPIGRIDKTQEREPGAQAVVEGCSIAPMRRRQPHAGSGCWLVGERIVAVGGAGFWKNDWRVLVGIAELNTPALVLGIAERGDAAAGLCVQARIARTRLPEYLAINLCYGHSHLRVSARCLAVPQPNRAAFGVIRGKQRGTTKTVYARGEFPAKIYRIGYTRVHAVPTGRYVLMRGISCQENTAHAVAPGDDEMRRPGISHQDLVVERPAGEAPQTLVRVNCRRGLAGIKPHLQRPDRVVVLRDERAPRRLVVPGDAKGLQDAAGARPEVDHVALHHSVLSIESDIEALAHAAAAAVAPHEIGATYGLGGARLNVS